MDVLVEGLRLAQTRARAMAAERAAAHVNHAKRQAEHQEASEMLTQHLTALSRIVGSMNVPPGAVMIEAAAVSRAEVNLAAAEKVVEIYVQRDAEAQAMLREAEGRVEEMREQEAAREQEAERERQRAAREWLRAQLQAREEERMRQVRERLRQQEQWRQEAQARARAQEEWNRRQAEMRQQQRNRPTLPLAACNAWKTRADAVLINFSELKFFPTPPVSGTCKKQSCIASKDTRALQACPCDIQALFEVLKATVSLKEERRKWHPDRFSACREDKKEKFQAMAREIFLVVDAMYRAEQEDKQS